MLNNLFRTRTQRLLIPSSLILLLLLALGACYGSSPNLGRVFQGRTLFISVVEVQRLPVLQYSTITQLDIPQDPQCAPSITTNDVDPDTLEEEGIIRHWRLTPSEEDFELVLLRLKVENHKATSALFTVDEQGAELRDLSRGTYFPIMVADRQEETPDPPDTVGPSIFINGTFELRKNCGIDGWLLFEAPKGTKFRSLRWAAGDTVIIDL